MDSHIIRRPLTPGRVLKVSSILGVSLAVTVIISLMLGTANVSLEDVLRMFFHGSQVKESARLIPLPWRPCVPGPFEEPFGRSLCAWGIQWCCIWSGDGNHFWGWF